MVGIAVASVAGFLLVASGVIFFLARTLREQYDKDESEDPIRYGNFLPFCDNMSCIYPVIQYPIAQTQNMLHSSRSKHDF